ncbi:glycosyltransferase family 4 protein [Luethyella okanaganae]|uniref:D-inositol 3-phosphate glycosyltransferase n=1 Tax=Luethyella okanaganae TaxID=69372 RepID=A0ABW1VCD0_9MICO
MKIGMLSQWFDPEPGPAAIPGVLAREFHQLGHSVKVLTGFPNYPDGRIYQGYRQRLRYLTSEPDYDLTRVALYPNHSSSAFGRIANYGSFGLSATVAGLNALNGVDAVWVYNSPITVSLPLLAHTRRGRTPYFLHVQDLWPESLIESGMFPTGRAGDLTTRLVKRIVRTTERRSAVVGVISPSVREFILDRHPGLDPSKIVYVPNPTDEGLFVPMSEVRRRLSIRAESGVFTLMYVGSVGEVQGLDTLLGAAELLRDRQDLRIIIVGDGIARERLEAHVRRHRLDHVSFTGRIPKVAVPEVMARADAQLVSLADSAFLRHTTPSKIASLLASQVPIIGLIAGDGEKLLRESGAAMTANPGDTVALAEAISDLATMTEACRDGMARAGRRYYDENLSAKIVAERTVNALSLAIEGRSSSG